MAGVGAQPQSACRRACRRRRGNRLNRGRRRVVAVRLVARMGAASRPGDRQCAAASRCGGCRKAVYYPATLTACGWLVLLAAFAFATPRGQGTEQTAAPLPFGRMRAPDGSENARYLALGLALLAVVALALWRSQKNLASVGSSLPQFFAGLPAHSDLLPWPHLIGLAVLALLAIVGLFRLATGRRGPLPQTRAARRGRRHFLVPPDGGPVAVGRVSAG